MTKLIFGDIVCKSVPYSGSLRKRVEGAIGEWLDQLGNRDAARGVNYQVAFERTSDSDVTCHLLLNCRSGSWAGSGAGTDSESALMRGLANLRAKGMRLPEASRAPAVEQAAG